MKNAKVLWGLAVAVLIAVGIVYAQPVLSGQGLPLSLVRTSSDGLTTIVIPQSSQESVMITYKLIHTIPTQIHLDNAVVEFLEVEGRITPVINGKLIREAGIVSLSARFPSAAAAEQALSKRCSTANQEFFADELALRSAPGCGGSCLNDPDESRKCTITDMGGQSCTADASSLPSNYYPCCVSATECCVKSR